MKACSRTEKGRRPRCGRHRFRCGERSDGRRLTTGPGLFFKASGSDFDWWRAVANCRVGLRQLAIDEAALTRRLERVKESNEVGAFLVRENEAQLSFVVKDHVGDGRRHTVVEIWRTRGEG